MSARSHTGAKGMRELAVEEADIVSGARPFGDCTDHVADFGLFYIKVISCPDGTSVSIGTPLFGGHSMPL